jgi:GNAT superfamily N-acetyltransferase
LPPGLFTLSSAAVIRDASLDDAAAAAALLALVTPEFVTTAAATRHNMTTSPPEARRRWWSAERDGELIGWTSLGLVVETSVEGVAWFSLAVHPEYRSQGIGAALADLAEEHATTIGARRLHAWSRADDASVAFASSRGFGQTGSHDILAVDPRTIPAPDPPRGVELLPFTAFDDDPAPVYHVDTVAMLDEPGEVTFDDVPLDLWLQSFWRHPLLDRDASMVAVVDGTPAAVTFIQTDRGRGRGTNNGTGTLPEYRGRGLATLAKRASLSRAAGLGVTAVYTGNDVTNAPMQAINRKLGYTPCSTMLNWAKDVVTS